MLHVGAKSMHELVLQDSHMIKCLKDVFALCYRRIVVIFKYLDLVFRITSVLCKFGS